MDVEDPRNHDALWRAMQPTSDLDIDTEMAREKRGAARFFWMWLIVATATVGRILSAVEA
jgi:hypothetical protein